MKLVLTYGGGFESGPVNRCMEYESAEALLCHIEEKVNAYLAALKIYQEKFDEYQKQMNVFRASHARPTKNEAARKKYDEESSRIFMLRPEMLHTEFELGGVKFDAGDFTTQPPMEPTREKFVQGFGPPEIQTLDEWFESNKEN